MIAAPAKIAAPTRVSSAPGHSTRDTEAAADSADASVALDPRITARVTRSPTPEDDALERQRQEFDFITRVQAESEREINALRDMAMEQMKFEDALLKKSIALIS